MIRERQMTRDKLVSMILDWETICWADVRTRMILQEMFEIAPGVIAAIDDVGDTYIFYDNTELDVTDDTPLEDFGCVTEDFPQTLGLLEVLGESRYFVIAGLVRNALYGIKNPNLPWPWHNIMMHVHTC
jgi:hypothetical protein